MIVGNGFSPFFLVGKRQQTHGPHRDMINVVGELGHHEAALGLKTGTKGRFLQALWAIYIDQTARITQLLGRIRIGESFHKKCL